MERECIRIHLLTKIAELSICQFQRPYTKIICPVNQGRKNFCLLR